MLKTPFLLWVRCHSKLSLDYLCSRGSKLAVVCLAVWIILASASTAGAFASDLVGNWSFDEGEGTTTADFSGNENTGTLINEPSWGRGKYGHGLSFNGLDQYVEIAHSQSLNIKNELTVSAWIYNQAPVNSLLADPEYHIIASKGWAPDPGGSWTLAWDKKSNDLLFCARKSSDKGYNCAFFNYGALATDWHLLTAVFKSGKVRLYVDGLPAAGPVAVGSAEIMTNTENVRIGAVLQDATNFLQGWEGSIDEVQIYNKALADREIKALYQATASQKTTNSTVSEASSLSATSSGSTSNGRPPVAAPLITPMGGSYATAVSVTLSSGTPGAFIYYTTDGASPTQSSTLYKNPFTVSKTTLVKAKAFKNNLDASSEASAWFTMDQPFDFSLSNTGDKAANKGASAQNSITAALKSGSSKPIAFSVSGLPSGATSAFSNVSCNPSCSSTLTINTSGSTPSGTFPINVTGSDGGVSRSSSFNLTVSDLPTVATPTITPNGGSYTGSVSVTMTTATAGAAIRYTTDGSNPTTSSTLYSSAINLTNSATVKAAAFMSGYNPSSTASAAFTITQPFDFSLSNAENKSLVAGSFTTNSITATLLSGSAQAVTFSASGLPAGVIASFSSPSCAPTCSSTLTLNTTAGTTPAGTFPITVSAPTGNGLNRTTTFNLTVSLPTVATPTITPNGGSYTGSVLVSMATTTTGASIRYTTDGTNPTASSTLYSGAISLGTSATVKAAAFKSNYNPSGVASASFTINQPFDFSLANSGNKSVTAGASVTNSITAALISGNSQAVSFSVSGLPSGATGSFSSTSCSPTCSTDFTIITTGSTPADNFPITVSSIGGGVTKTTAFNLTVSLMVATPTITVDRTYAGYTTAPIDDGVINATGGTASTWASDETVTDHWVNVAFPSPRQINSAIVHWAYNNYQQAYMTAQSVNIQYWNGSYFQTISSLAYPGSDVSSSSASFPTVTTSQLRFLMPAGQGNPGYTNVFWITELDYGMDIVAPPVITPTVAAPTITPNGGSFTGSVSVAMQAATSGASIYYTTDGSTPTQSSNLYTGAMTLTSSAVVKAKAFKSGYNASAVTSASFAVASSPQSTGNVYYVAKTGSNSNSCTQAKSGSTPKLTIAAGLACMVSGDTLKIGDGTYTESITYNQLISGVDDSHRTIIQAVNPLGAILRPVVGALDSSGSSTGAAIWVYGKSYVTFDGLDVDAGLIDNSTVGLSIYLNNSSSHIRIQNSVLRNSTGGQACLSIQGYSSYTEVRSNKIHHCGTSSGALYGYNIYIRGNNNLIEHNELYNAQSWCVHEFTNNAGTVYNNIVRYNKCHNSGNGILQGGGSNNIAHNNIIRNVSGWGMAVRYGDADNNMIYNNTIYGGGSNCIFVSDAQNTKITNNLCLSNNDNTITDLGTATTTASNRLSTDNTLVVDAPNNNFTPSQNSSLIDAGQMIPGFSAGNYTGMAPDVGAVELGATGYYGTLAQQTQ
jgi:hypothetical protein